MAEARADRRLAAILSADVVGYSRLMLAFHLSCAGFWLHLVRDSNGCREFAEQLIQASARLDEWDGPEIAVVAQLLSDLR